MNRQGLSKAVKCTTINVRCQEVEPIVKVTKTCGKVHVLSNAHEEKKQNYKKVEFERMGSAERKSLKQ